MNTPVEDTELYTAIASGSTDPVLWKRFVDRYSKLIYHAIHRALARQGSIELEEVQEVFQAFFVKLLEDDRLLLRRYKGTNGCSPGTYLAQIAVYQALDHQRRTLRRTRRMTLVDPLQPSPNSKFEEDHQTPSAAHQLMQAEEAQQLRSLIETLKPRDRLFYELVYVQGRNMTDVGRMLQLNESSVHVMHFRLKERLKKLLDAQTAPAVAG
ncbi:MAG: RNA polymerase sigma factor [Myxococcota bacterium]